MTQPMDRISIAGLRAHCILGVHEWERLIKHEIRLDLTVQLDAARAAKTDDVRNAVDYSRLANRVLKRVRESRFHLVESLAQSVADVCLATRGVQGVQVRVEKVGALAAADSVAVEITRMRDSA